MRTPRHESDISAFIIARGWKKYPIGNWWYKPEPEWGEFIPNGVELHGIAGALQIELKRPLVHCKECGQLIEDDHDPLPRPV